jgi:Tol biopolymer transport system component
MKNIMRHWLSAILLLLIIGKITAQEEFYHLELEWRTIQTDHFYVHYHTGTERTARITAKIAEEIYEPITSLYHYKPEGRVSFIIKDYDDFSNGATYFFDNKIEIWSSALDYDLRGTHNWLRNVISHEYTHLIQIQTALKFGRKVPAIYLQWLQYESERRTDVLYGYPNGIVSYPISGFVVPVWFAEGVAQYNRKEFGYESWDSHRDMILRMYALEDKLLTWNEMSVFGKTSLGNESSYNSGYSLVSYLAKHYGEDKLREISEHLSSLTAVSIDGAIEKAIGKSGKELYAEWKEFLRKDYADRVAPIKTNIIDGEMIASEGFANFYPTFSPDGKKIIFISNKNGDYFGSSSLYLYDILSKTEKLLMHGVRSNLSWSPDGKKIYYSKISKDNPHWANVFDLYVYDIEQDEETRLTNGLRAGSPAVSPDGKTIAFVIASDGTINLFTSDIDGKNVKKLTAYQNGEQVYNPKWSPDGRSIIFDYSVRDGRDITIIPADGGEVKFILNTSSDERNAVFTSDGNRIIYSSDKTGIFNIYEYDLLAKTSVQLTNVFGGTFMPTVSNEGSIAFASYASGGFIIALLDSVQSLQNPGNYIQANAGALASVENENLQMDWKKLRSYDDIQIPAFKDTTYKNISTGLAFVPLLRVDNYNPKNKGIDVIKLGLYAYSYDVLDRYGFFAGGAMNLKGERDVFFTFDYRGKIPGLYQLGLEPALSLEAYNITRKTDSYIALPIDTIKLGISYNLIEFDVALKQKILNERLDAELRYAHSRYTATIGEFDLPGGLFPAFSELYLVGNNLSLTLRYDGILPSKTSEINPVGRKIRLRYEHEFNKFNPSGEYDVKNGVLVAKYEHINFNRLEIGWRESIKLPAWKHTLSAHLRGGTIFGPPVDNFFNFYIGGLAGMKGYSFYSLGGNEFAMANLTYRFPLLENIDLRFLQMQFNSLYASVYGDAGSAWTGGGLKNRKWKKDAGVELRIEAFSYYAFPTRIFLNATYGFDKFDYTIENSNKVVTYGREWNFHFGVLFGFDLD